MGREVRGEPEVDALAEPDELPDELPEPDEPLELEPEEFEEPSPDVPVEVDPPAPLSTRAPNPPVATDVQVPSAPKPEDGPAFRFVAFREFDAGPMDLLDRAGHEPQARTDLVALINQVLHAEAPVEAERLGKIVCRCLNFGRISPERVAQVLSFVPKAQITNDAIGRFVWHADQDPATWGPLGPLAAELVPS